MTTAIEIEKSSGNVFADLGLPDASEMYVKAVLAMKINNIIWQSRLTSQEVADRLGVTQVQLLALNRGSQLKIFSIDMLIGFLSKLDDKGVRSISYWKTGES